LLVRNDMGRVMETVMGMREREKERNWIGIHLKKKNYDKRRRGDDEYRRNTGNDSQLSPVGLKAKDEEGGEQEEGG
jgi:hypothetical protein